MFGGKLGLLQAAWFGFNEQNDRFCGHYMVGLVKFW